MASNGNETGILHDLGHLLRVYQDGRVERFIDMDPVPASLDPDTGVDSKDMVIISEKGVGVRLFKPDMVQCQANKKLPVLVYYHGGGFCVQSTYNAIYHNYLNSLASQARVLIVSVEYRLAPEHPVPACYDDGWDALNWVISHGHHLQGSSFNPEPWLMNNADMSRIFLAGDSAGGTIAHHVATRVGSQGLANGFIHQVKGLILTAPYIWGKDRIGDELVKLSSWPNPSLVDYMWEVVCPGTSGSDDPRINLTKDPNLGKLGTEKVVVFVAEKDVLRDRGLLYKETLLKSGWCGNVEVVESQGVNHGFHLFDPSCVSAIVMMRNVIDFINDSV